MATLRDELRTGLLACDEAIAEARREVNRWRTDPEASVVDQHSARFTLERLSEANRSLRELLRRLSLVTDATLNEAVAPPAQQSGPRQPLARRARPALRLVTDKK